MRKILSRLVGVAMVAIAPIAAAAPCVPGTLQDYFDLVDGCEIGVTSFSDFHDVAGPAGSTPIDPTLIQVTPNGSASHPALLFTLNQAVTAPDFLDNVFHFLVTGAPGVGFRGARAALTGASASGDGAVTLVEDLCVGGIFFPFVGPIGCSSLPDLLIPFATEAFSDTDVGTTFFFPVGLLDVYADFGIDGGLSGAAALVSATLAFAVVPEPPVLVLLTLALAALAVAARRRRLH